MRLSAIHFRSATVDHGRSPSPERTPDASSSDLHVELQFRGDILNEVLLKGVFLPPSDLSLGKSSHRKAT